MYDMKLILQLELFTLNDLTLKMSQNLYTKQIKDIFFNDKVLEKSVFFYKVWLFSQTNLVKQTNSFQYKVIKK